MQQNQPQKVEAKREDPEHPPQQEKGGMVNYISQANHPILCVVTICFKLSALVSFILLDLFLSSTALVYLVVILIASFDFWTTKNVSGRLLVGLRWWNEVREDGQEVWIFESKNEIKDGNADTRVFWTCLWTAPIVWAVLVIWDLIRLKFVWAIIASVCFIFAAVNWYGFFKCSKQQQENATKFGTKAAVKLMKKGGEAATKSNDFQ